MKKPEFKLVDDLSIADWVKETLYPWDKNNFLQLGTVIPEGFASYLLIRNENKVLGGEWSETFNHEKLILKLLDHTKTPERCFYGMWDGFGIDYEANNTELFKGKNKTFDKFSKRYWYENIFHLENRGYYLLEGTLLDSLKIVEDSYHRQIHEFVNILWPLDRAWFLAKEIDFEVTLIGGSAELINELEGSGHFKTERFTPQTRTNEIFLVDSSD